MTKLDAHKTLTELNIVVFILNNLEQRTDDSDGEIKNAAIESSRVLATLAIELNKVLDRGIR